MLLTRQFTIYVCGDWCRDIDISYLIPTYAEALILYRRPDSEYLYDAQGSSLLHGMTSHGAEMLVAI